MKNLREELANVQHSIWAHWMKYLFTTCQKNDDGSVLIPAEKVIRWTRQVNTEYKDLSEQEKKSDRDQADKILNLHQVNLEKILDELAIAAYEYYWRDDEDLFSQASDSVQEEWRQLSFAVIKKYEELKLQNPET